MASFTLDQESVGSLLSFQNLLLVLTLPALLSWAVLLFKYRQLSRFPSANVLSATSPFWLLWQARKARRSTAVMDLHQKTGSDFVRLTQRHVSIARREAVAPIYGHSSGLMKSGFYDAFEAYVRLFIASFRLLTRDIASILLSSLHAIGLSMLGSARCSTPPSRTRVCQLYPFLLSKAHWG